MLAHPRPDAILLDRGLPDGDGLDLCREVKARCPALPILVLTAHAQARGEALAAGADRFLVKPFDPDELAAAVAGLLPDEPEPGSP